MDGFIESYANPYIISCPCRKCSKGLRCKYMAGRIEAYELRQVLTEDDKQWLRSYGWI
jgi:hypothetical protein